MTVHSTDAVVLAIRGDAVTQLRFDFAFTIVTDGSAMRIETPFELVSPDVGPRLIDPEAPSHSDELLKLHQASVDGDCLGNGRLELRFSNGTEIRVPPDTRFEAWTLSRGNGEMAVATPGGGEAIFGPVVPREVEIDE